MDNDDNPALNADGTLKDASEIAFFHSPSDTQPLPKDNQIPDQGYESPSEKASARAQGLKGKEPARIVATKRTRNASSKARAQEGSGKLTHFFTANFVGKSFVFLS